MLHIRHDHYLHGDLDGIGRVFEQLARIEAQGVTLIMASAETNALLDLLDTRTNEMAAIQTADSTKVQEISDDLDDLIAQTTDPAIKARLQAHADALALVAATGVARSQDLTNLAAKHDKPIPPPVPIPPVE